MSPSPVILIMEDDINNRELTEKILKHSGFHVVSVTNGREGLSILENLVPDMIIMDLSMPLLDGWETTRIIKTKPEWQMIPVIAVTAHAMAEEIRRALEAGCDKYLIKPFHPHDLVSTVKNML